MTAIGRIDPLAVMAKPPSRPSDDKADREARLAAALRVNLRRRKAAARSSAPAAPEKHDPSDKG
ncbi:MAG: hypothetical protein Q7T61_14230 [Caulobacter sp.]|nr:hypothetical protein [Caulobacter sp.]